MEHPVGTSEIRFGYYLLQLETELPIRRGEPGEAGRLRGIVEDLRTGERLAFDGLRELGTVLGWETAMERDDHQAMPRAAERSNEHTEAR